MGLFGKSKAEKAQELMTNGSKGAGTVLQVQDTGMTVNDNPRVKMQWRIEPIDGGAAFDVEKTTTVSRLDIPRQGDRYPVWYDPSDVSKWAYATIADDTGRATIRQQFGDVAETFVGMGVPATPSVGGQGQDTVEVIKQLSDLHAQGALTDEEFAAQKAKLLG
jgi:hypothetical protein